MPTGLVRIQSTGTDLHFVTFSCRDRRPRLATPQSRDIFERSLERMRERYGFTIRGYVVMPEHVHLLLSEPEVADLASALQALKLSTTVGLGRERLWAKRYYDFNVYTGSKTSEKLRYMHRNPVARGLVAKPEEWPWSSFNQWLTGRQGTVQIETDRTAHARFEEERKSRVEELAKAGTPRLASETWDGILPE